MILPPPLKEEVQSPDFVSIDEFWAAVGSVVEGVKPVDLLSNEVRRGKYIVKIHTDLESVGRFYLHNYASENALNLKSVDTNKRAVYFEFGGSKILLFEESDARRIIGGIYRVGGDYFQQFISVSNHRLDQTSESRIVSDSEYLVFRKRVDYGVTPTSSLYEPDFLTIHMLYFCNFAVGNTDYVH
jgi:hypothetical protein